MMNEEEKEVCLTRELVIVLESKPNSSIPENEGEYTYVGFSHPYEVTNTRSLEVFMDEYDGFCFNLSSTRALKQVACRMYGNQKIKAILDDYEHANSVSKYDTERINIHIYGTKYEIHKFDISIQKNRPCAKNHHPRRIQSPRYMAVTRIPSCTTRTMGSRRHIRGGLLNG